MLPLVSSMVTTVSDVTTAEVARTINTGERAGYDTRKHLEHAARQARERNYENLLIVDADAHHYETESWPDIVKYIEDPIIRHRGQGQGRFGNPTTLMYTNPGNQSVAGRVIRYPRRRLEETEEGTPRDVQLVRREMESIGINYQVVFPTPMLDLGMHPDPRMEVAISWAYSRWLTEEILPQDPRIKTMIYLPFNDPEASLRAVEYFSEKPGVAGFMVTSARYRPVHHNAYMPVYRALEERGMPLGFFLSNGASEVRIMYSLSSRCIMKGTQANPFSIQRIFSLGNSSGMPLMTIFVRCTRL